MNLALEDSTTEKVPQLLNVIADRILTQSKSCDSIQKNLMFVLIIVVMVENGFLPSEEDKYVDPYMLDIERLKKWQYPSGVLEINFTMSGFYNNSLKLVVSPLGATVLVNLVIKDLNSETYSACLPISRYVVSPQASTIPMMFRDLRHLSVTLKNKVLSPVKSQVLSYNGYASASLIGLPEEVLFNIMVFLPVVDIIKLSKTCKRLNGFLNNEILWHRLCKRDFGITQTDVTSWKILYKENHSKREDYKLRQTQRQAGTMHDFMDHSDYMSYIDNPMWGGIL